MASELPEDVWALILAHVPQTGRLKHCALVCQKLSRAAAAATHALRVSLWRSSYEQQQQQQQRQQRAEAFDSYLQHHGSHVTSLVLQNGGQPLMRLPCPQLLHLNISSADPMQLGLPGVLDSCATGLTRLELSDCTVTPTDGLSRLSVLVDLRELQIEHVEQPSGGWPTLPCSVLSSLMHLTRLQLSYIAGVEDVHHVSSLTSLSVLRIEHVLGQQPLRLAPGIAPGFVLPASLQQLRVANGVVLDPAVLAAATQLTSVELLNMSVEVQGGGVASGAALLAAVAGLQQLVTLELHWLVGIVWPAPSAAYTALAASSKLQTLVLRECGLPEGVWEHVFPPAHSCPALRWFGASEGDDDDVGFWGVEAVSRVVRCSPGLQSLDLRLSGAPAVAALKPLMSLTKLELFVDCADDEAHVASSVKAIAAFTGLQWLDLRLSTAGENDAATAAVCAAALLPLTALRQLTWCHVILQSVQANGIGNRLVDFLVNNKADPGQPPDVWLQVLERCLIASNCQPAVIAVAKQQAERAAQQEQLNEQLQQQVAELKQQDTAQEQRMAQQEQQIAALQAQVQQLLTLLPQPVVKQ